MKAEERHKLETNILADWLGQAIEDVKPYSRAIITGLVVLVVVLVGVVLWPRFAERASASAWEAYYAALSNDNFTELERIAEDHPGTSVASWSLAVAADARLANGCMQLFVDKVSAAQELRRAIEDYGMVIDQAREPQLRERALFGRARAYEAVSGSRQGEGELPKAIADYERLVKDCPNGAYAPMAGEQLKRLNSQEFKVFYDKFAAYSPKRPVSKEPEAGAKLPFDSSSLPDDAGPSEFSKLLNLDDLKVKGAKKSDDAAKGEPDKKEPPKTEATKTGGAKAEPPKTPPAKTGETKAEAPKAEPAKTSAPKTEPPKSTPTAPAKSEPAKK